MALVLPAADFRFSLNGHTVRVDGLPAQLTLLDYIRARGLTGAKEGCAEGECGACAVLVVSPGPVPGRSVYRSVNSCLVPLPAAAGQEVYTVEGLSAKDRLCEVQQAMAARGGSQCGYCTPGFVVSMVAEQHRSQPGAREVDALGGNLCRCTGYRPIRDALLSLGPADGVMAERLLRPANPMAAVRYPGFTRPVSLQHALTLAAEDPAAQFVSGNTDLGVAANLRDVRYQHLVSLEAIPELRELHDGEDAVELGAGLTLTEITDLWTGAPAVFAEWLRLFASVLIRNRATLGGNLATASPIGDSAPLLLALQAEVRIASLAGDRLIPLSKFFHGYRQTALGPGEIIRSIRIPKPFPEHARFYKVAKRSLDDISTVAAGIAMSNGQMRIGLGGVAATPLLAFEGDPADARETLHRTLKPMSDHRGSAAYRLAMAGTLADKFLEWRSQL